MSPAIYVLSHLSQTPISYLYIHFADAYLRISEYYPESLILSQFCNWVWAPRSSITRENLIDPLYQRWRLRPITGKANRIASHSPAPNGEGAEVRPRDSVCVHTYDYVCASGCKGSMER